MPKLRRITKETFTWKDEDYNFQYTLSVSCTDFHIMMHQLRIDDRNSYKRCQKAIYYNAIGKLQKKNVQQKREMSKRVSCSSSPCNTLNGPNRNDDTMQNEVTIPNNANSTTRMQEILIACGISTLIERTSTDPYSPTKECEETKMTRWMKMKRLQNKRFNPKQWNKACCNVTTTTITWKRWQYGRWRWHWSRS